MKRFIKSLCLIGSIFSLSACESYGPEIKAEDANKMLVKITDAEEPNAYSTNVKINSNAKSVSKIPGIEATTKTKINATVSKSKKDIYLYEKIYGTISVNFSGADVVQDVYEESWIYYRGKDFYNVTNTLNENGTRVKECTKTEMSLLDAQSEFATYIDTALAEAISVLSIDFGEVQTFDSMLASAYASMTSEITYDEKDTKTTINQKYYSKGETNLTAIISQKSKYTNPVKGNEDDFKYFKYDMSFKDSFDGAFCGNESFKYTFEKAKFNCYKSKITASYAQETKEECQLNYPDLTGYAIKLS